MRRYTDDRGDLHVWPMARDAVLLTFFVVAASLWGCPQYRVWEQGLAGEAELKRAEQNRRIKVQEAQAVLDSAKLLGDAEIVRARGVAESNRIIGGSLEGNEAYLRYLWVQGMQTNQMQVVYVPTEANMPILEAGAGRWRAQSFNDQPAKK